MPDARATMTAGMFVKKAAPKGWPTAGPTETGEASPPVPLVGVLIDADISSFYAKVVVAHRYVNRETVPIEAVYVFPLDEGAAVCAFEAIVDGTLVVGEVHERDEAFERYDDAMEQGHGAFLLDEERPDVFQASVGNLAPGKEVLVKLTYVSELAVEGDALRFVIPTTVSPRYAPAADRVGMGRSDEEALNPPVAMSVPYGLNLSVRIVMPGAISGVESPSHPISLKLKDREATITFAQGEAALDRDFVLSVDAAGLDAPHALVERDDERTGAGEPATEAIGVAFAPRFTTTSAPADVIFLVDRSGSMKGTSIDEVRNALQLCLRSLTPGCRFNIVGFGSTYESLFHGGSRGYDQIRLDLATQFVAGMDADLGGTELLPALQAVLEQTPSSELARQLVILTDGEVTNTDAVIALARKHAATTRIFTFGIGAGASHHLVRGLARAGGGTAEFIHPGERIEPKVLRQLARLLSPALTDVRVEWDLPAEARRAKGAGKVTQAPATIPPVFAGGRLLVYGLVTAGRPSSVRLTATGPSGPLSFEVPIPEPVARSTRTVSTLAARARIRELEEGSEWLAARGSQQKDRKVNSARSEIIALSLRYKLMSRETSFVAIEQRETPVTGDVKLRKVPIALTAGWGGLQRRRLEESRVAMSAFSFGDSAPMPPAAEMGGVQRQSSPPARSSGMGSTEWFSRLGGRGARERSTPSRPAGVAPVGMHALILLQAADGAWELTPELAKIMGRTVEDLRAAAPTLTERSPNEVSRAWATALALTWLEQFAAGTQDEWTLIAYKAKRWLAFTSKASPSEWMALAHKVLRGRTDVP